MTQPLNGAFPDTKPHYAILDGLRGVAALVVVCFHLFEAYATSHLDQRINHGYLAVDFFFLLSGFVIGYAYDDRWRHLTAGAFLKRRLVRLHPMILFGALLGGAMFYVQECPVWDVASVSLGALVVATLLNALLLPAPVGCEIRGLGEMYPLNGPSWSLLFEYIANLCYALFIHRLSTRALAALVAATGAGLALYATLGPLGDICVGYSLTGMEFLGGMLRVLFAFPAGLLLFRLFRRGGALRIRGAFWWSGLAVVALLAVPRIGGADARWMNGIYDTLCAVAAFPLLVWIGASGQTTDRFAGALCRLLGAISYPLYIVHYPFIYLYYGWVKREQLTFGESLPGAAALVAGCLLLAWVSLKYYDIPIRKWLTERLLGRPARPAGPNHTTP